MRVKLVVVGEAILDIDVAGEARRLSPDAPVPVLEELVESRRPGGAALAASMAALDGADVILATPVATDQAAGWLEELLPHRVHLVRLPQSGGTPVKRRIRSHDQSIVRLDEGGMSAPWESVPTDLLRALSEADAVLVSDYGRGLTLNPLLRETLAGVIGRRPLVWDPHPRGGIPLPGCTLLTPNENELSQLAATAGPGTEPPAGLNGMLDQIETIFGWLDARAIAVTIGARGAILSIGRGTPQITGTQQVHGHDACGAGDQFAATATHFLAQGALVSESVQHAVAAASRHVAAGGAATFGDRLTTQVAPPTTIEHVDNAPRLAASIHARHGSVVATGGCFDILHAGHVSYLQSARQLGDCLIVCLNSDASVRRLKGPTRPVIGAQDRAKVLLSLECVDAVMIFDEDSPEQAIRLLRPHIWVKGGDYAGDMLSESIVLREWGGRALTVPYLDGRSTTAMLRTIAQAANGMAETGKLAAYEGVTNEY